MFNENLRKAIKLKIYSNCAAYSLWCQILGYLPVPTVPPWTLPDSAAFSKCARAIPSQILMSSRVLVPSAVKQWCKWNKQNKIALLSVQQRSVPKEIYGFPENDPCLLWYQLLQMAGRGCCQFLFVFWHLKIFHVIFLTESNCRLRGGSTVSLTIFYSQSSCPYTHCVYGGRGNKAICLA